MSATLKVAIAIDSQDSLTIGEISRRTGVAHSALHFYESMGLISSTRTTGNQRRYSRHMVRRISLIVVAKRLGIPLADVLEAFEPLPHDRKPTSREWHRVASVWRETLRERMSQLERLENQLTGCIGCGCLSMKACILLNPDDEMAQRGPGPHLLEAD